MILSGPVALAKHDAQGRQDEKCGRSKGQDAPVRCVDNVAKTMARVLEVVKWRDKKIRGRLTPNVSASIASDTCVNK